MPRLIIFLKLLIALAMLGLTAGCGTNAHEPAATDSTTETHRAAPAAATADTPPGYLQSLAPADTQPSASILDAHLGTPPFTGTLLVIGPEKLLDPAAVKLLIETKRPLGWRVWVTPLKDTPTTQQVLDAIHTAFDKSLQFADDNRPAGHVLLVGDCASGPPGATSANRLPCAPRNSSFLGAIASDFPYTLPTPERRPRLAVGRLPVRTAAEFAACVQRIRNLERDPPEVRTALRNRLHFIAGAPGYSPTLDKLIENFAFTVLTEQVPPELDLRVLYTAPTSDYSTGALETDRAEAEDLIEEGAFATVICSHGTITAISGRARERLLENEHMAALSGKASRTHLFIFTCSSGNFANAPQRSPTNGQLINDLAEPDQQSLAEVTVLNPHGPLFVVAASSFSHPLFNKYYCDLLIDEVLKKNPVDWGEAWYRVQRRFATYRDKDLEVMLKDVEKIGDLETAAIDHSYMYNLLGDPTLAFERLDLGAPLTADRRPDPSGDSGAIRVYGRAQDIPEGLIDIEVTVTRADIAKQRPKFKASMTPAEHTAVAVDRYRLTTDKTIARATVKLQDGQFSQVFHLAGTDWLRAKQVRILIHGQRGWSAAGIADIAAAAPRLPALTTPPAPATPATPPAADLP